MNRMMRFSFIVLLLIGLLVPGASALTVVTTMPNVWDVTQEVGGSDVEVIYVAPPAAVHISGDTIDALLQQNSEYIKDADLFIGQGGGMDETVITKITEFREKNYALAMDWAFMNETPTTAVPAATVVYDNPTSLAGYTQAIAYILKQADPANATVYNANCADYLARVTSATALTATEQETLSGVPIICHFRIKNQAETWLGMNVVTSYPQPETVQAIIDDIRANPDKYRTIAESSSCGKIFVIENIVAGQNMGIGVHEALLDENIPCERVIFLNLPKSANNVDSILDYYAYNKALILDRVSTSDTEPVASPIGLIPIIGGILCAAVLFRRR